MIFSEPRFLVFLALVVAVHWALRGREARKLWLLAASWAFYCAWDWRLLSLILVSTGVDLVSARRIHAARTAAARGRWLAFSLVANLGLLGFFKYFGWFVASAVELSRWLGIPAGEPALAIVLPVGISFYTFQTLSYTIDVWRGELSPAPRALDVALFVAFFPQLVAGPIVRARDFLPQLAAPVRWARVDARAALLLFLSGFVKKAVVSDTLAAGVVDPFFVEPAAWGAASALLAVAGELVVLYCDFSGYSDMAIGSAALLGYRLPLNFDFPLLATSTTDFWRRWHVSLTTWMRDYVYLPLGGPGRTRATHARNVLVTMLAIGLWHGAAWRFALFGLAHGLGLVAHRSWARSALARRLPRGAGRAALGWALTLALHLAVMPLFRAADVGQAARIVATLATGRAAGERSFAPGWLAVLALLAAAHVVAARGTRGPWWRRPPGWAFACGFGLAAALALSLATPLAEPFVYFRF